MQLRRLSTFVLALAASAAMLHAADGGIGIQGLVHAGVAVTDLDRAMHFYVDQLGFKEAFRLKKPDGTPKLVYLQINDETFVEIFPGVTRTPPQSATTFHIGLVVANLQAALHALKDKGYALPDNAFERAAKVADDGTNYYMIRDPDGNFVELSQMNPQALEAKASKKLMKIAKANKER